MKLPLASSFFSAALLAAPAFSATGPQNVRQDVNRLVLLPGPYLTSPAKGAPQPKPVETATPGMVKMGSGPDAAFESPGSLRFTPGAFHLGGSEKPREFTAPKKTPASPDPNSLRFEEKLPATTTPGSTTLARPKNESSPPTQPKRD